MKNEETIIKYLAEIEYDYYELSDKVKAYLEKIEESISEIFKREEEARRLLTSNHMSVRNVSEKADISRQTLYTHVILKEYIESRALEFKKYDISNRTQELAEMNQILLTQIQKMHRRDSEIEELKLEVNNLKDKLKDKDEELKRAKQRINNIRS